MDQDNKKIINLCLIILGILVAVVAAVLMTGLMGAFGWAARLFTHDILRHGIPVAIGVATFFSLRLNAGVMTWADEVVSETKKVVWPTRKETATMTVVVCVMVVIAGAIFAVFDMVSHAFVQWFVG